MTWEQKIQACQALGEFSLKMRHPGDWYVSHNAVEKGDGHVLSGGCVTGAATPEVAVEKHWKWLTSAEDGDRIVLNAMRSNRKELRWNGFMWQELEMEETK